MGYRILLLGTLICVLFSLQLQAQTRFNEYVSIDVIKNQTPDSLINAFGQSEFFTMKGLLIKVLETRNKAVKLELKAGQQHNTELEKIYSGVKHTISTDSIVARDTTLNFTIKEKYSDIAPIDSGRYVANIHTSNDTLYINFWLEQINDSTYYEVDNPEKYDWNFVPTKKYFVTLKNRQSIVLWGFNYEISALTMPFKLHFGYDDVSAQFNSQVNISTYIGRRFSRHNYRYDTYEGMKKSESSFSGGIIFGISSTSVDSTNSSITDLSPTSVPVFSAGMGGVFNFGDFNLGIFGGYDIGIGSTASKWNFHQKPWMGFGFGYKVALFGNSE